MISAPGLVVLICIPAILLLWMAWTRSETGAFPLISLTLLIGFGEVCILALSRTLAVRTLTMLVTVGAGAVALGAVAITGGLRTLLDFRADRALLGLVDSMSFYLVAPLVEGILTLVPMLAVLFFSTRARGLTVVDVLLLGFLVGTGFQFTETIAGRGPGNYLAGLFAIPAGAVAENWQGVFRHGVAAGLIAGVTGFWWRARRQGRRTKLSGWLVWIAVFFVLVLHLAVNVSDGIAPLWEPLADVLTSLARSPVLALLPVLFIAVGVSAVIVDLRDLRAAAPLRSLLLPVDRGDMSMLAGYFHPATAPRLRRLAAVRTLNTHQAPSRRLGSPATTLSIGTVGAVVIGAVITATVAASALDGDEPGMACLACVWESAAGLPAAGGMALLTLALLVPQRRSVRGVAPPSKSGRS